MLGCGSLLAQPPQEIDDGRSVTRSESAGDAVSLPSPQVIFVRQDGLAGLCASANVVNGCTHFRNLAVTCECRKTTDGWRRASTLSATAVIILADAGYLTHEMTHVQDMRSLMRRYVQSVASRSYPSLGECEAGIATVRSSFLQELDRFRRITAVRRDHTPRAGVVLKAASALPEGADVHR